MIVGIGHDLCSLARMAQAQARQGARLPAKILTPTELQEWQQRHHQHPGKGLSFLAMRFAAKEAFCKAMGWGFRAPMSWHGCEVRPLPGGRPSFVFHHGLLTWWQAQHPLLCAHLSLSDDGDYASAFVVIEQTAAVPV
jgi:holo-[acyl-carrier protein] synthase